uniref:Uncharacterized protein n=1 Tax=Kalanchoe fedtschenkoi TaxID=63787 RepID=A0A7N0UBR5_KALFE
MDLIPYFISKVCFLLVIPIQVIIHYLFNNIFSQAELNITAGIQNLILLLMPFPIKFRLRLEAYYTFYIPCDTGPEPV